MKPTKSAPGTKGWDVDLGHGHAGENALIDIVKGKVEVKRDRVACFSGRLVVEFEYKGKPSGIATTTAQWWAFAIDDTEGKMVSMFLVPTSRLKQLARESYRAGMIVSGGDDCKSRMVFIPLPALYGAEDAIPRQKRNR